MLLEQKGSVAANMRPTDSSVCVLLERKGSVAVNMPPSVSSVCLLFEQKGSVAANIRPTVSSVCVLLEQKGTVAASMRPTVLLRPVKGLSSLPPVYIHSCFVLFVCSLLLLLLWYACFFVLFLSANATSCLYIIFEVLCIHFC